MNARNEFARLVAREPIPLAHGALLIAREEYPQLEINRYLDRIAALAAQAEATVSGGENTVERVQLLSNFLFEERGFAGNRDDYSDPRNSYLNEVLDRGLGIPITLSLIYLEVGRRVGLNLYGVSFPAHFLVKAVDDRGELIIDPFNGGAILQVAEIRARLTQIYGQPVELAPAMLQAVNERHILVRMLRNLKNIYLNAGDYTRLLAALDRILILDAGAMDELFERAALYERMECFKAALDDYQSFIGHAPGHLQFDAARESVMRLAAQVARIS